jgi:glycosyltransferase involved in cell wall biosynthesis
MARALAATMPAPIVILQPPAENELTGGYLYNLRMGEGARETSTRSVPAAQLPGALEQARRQGARVLIDSLYIGEDVDWEALSAHGLLALIHHLPSLDPGFPQKARAEQLQRERRLLEAARGIVVTSASMRELLRAQGLGVPIVACPPGVDEAFFEVARAQEGDPPEIVTVANFEPRKGQLELAAAMAKLTRAHALVWHLIGDDRGDPAYAAAVREELRAHRLEQVAVWHGRLGRDALLTRLGRASAHVLPTRFETYGMVVAESLAAGVPVVAPRIGEIQHLVRHGETGLLTEPGAPEALAEAAARLLSDVELRGRMRRELDRRRNDLPRWSDAARAFVRGVEELPS